VNAFTGGGKPASSKPVLYLHVGAAKSGSSAIQALLRDNSSLLRERGYLVPAPDLNPNGRISGGHVEFFEQLMPVTATSIATATDRLAALARYARGQGFAAAVLSAENLVNNSELPRMFQPVRDDFELHVVVYIRRQDEYLVGAWSQWHFKESESFQSWVASVVRLGLANWDNVVTWWEQALPGALIDVRLFDRKRFPGGDVALDFLQAIGADSTGMVITGETVNRTLNEVAMRVASRNRDLFADAQDHGFLEFLATNGGEAAVARVNTGLFFDDAHRRSVLEAYSASNERLRARYFPGLPPGGLFAVDGPEMEPISHERQIELELDLLWNVIYRLSERTRPDQ
jgi:hypothetical protein